MPKLRELCVGEMAGIAHDLRAWTSYAGLEILTRRGLVWYGEVWDDGREWPAWIITDNARRNAQARRLDGQPWSGIGSKKAKSIPGIDPSWPVGAPDAARRPKVVLCEGQPDFCAAPLVAWWEGLDLDQVGFVCMTGAGVSINPEASSHFAGKAVRIAVHDDPQGRIAAKKWADQLYAAGAVHVDGFDFSGLSRHDGAPVKDLADFATMLELDCPIEVRVFGGF